MTVPASATILVVEDDAAIRSGIQRILERAGYTILTASTPIDAIQLAADHELPIRLLVTDFGLHAITGRQVAEILRRDRPGLRVLYVSGHSMAKVLPHGLPRGAAFLQKPFSMSALLHHVRELLDEGDSLVRWRERSSADHSAFSRYPTPGSVTSSRGRAGSASSFCRNCAMYTRT
jgi:two-component system, cell cycle sensor histidine kinase and response regulator CckA